MLVSRARGLPALLLPVLLTGCAGYGPAGFATWDIEPDALASEPEVVFHGIPLRSGQIVASEQGSPQSLFLSLLVAEPSPWVHTGILVVEDGVPWLYETQGQVRPSFRGPPNRNIGGGVRRVSLESFLRLQRFVGIYEPPDGVDLATVAAFARARHAERTPFDAYFDLDDSSKLYCGELTSLALTAGGAPARQLSAMNPNQSVGVITAWLEITTDTIIPAGNVVADARRVALISERHSPAQVEAYFAARIELQRRFTPEQKLGNVLSFSPVRLLRFRPGIQAYLDAVDKAAQGWDGLPAAEIDERVRGMARQLFGAYAQPGQRVVEAD